MREEGPPPFLSGERRVGAQRTSVPLQSFLSYLTHSVSCYKLLTLAPGRKMFTIVFYLIVMG